MPRKPDKSQALCDRWTLYVNPVEKLRFMAAVAGEQNDARHASAAVRAFMNLFVTDQSVRDKVMAILPNYVVKTKNGGDSIL